MGKSDHSTSYMRAGGDDGKLRPWHFVYEGRRGRWGTPTMALHIYEGRRGPASPRRLSGASPLPSEMDHVTLPARTKGSVGEPHVAIVSFCRNNGHSR